MAPVTDLDERTFLRIVETGSLSAAARDLATDVSTVSRRLAGLEARLGLKLIERGGRVTRVTEVGLRYHAGLRSLIDARDALEEELRGETNELRGLLRVSAPVNLGERHLASWLAAFGDQHAGLRIELVLSDTYVDLRAGGIDVAIRIGALSDSALTARRLGRMTMTLAGSASYLAKAGTPLTPGDLAAHRFVLFSLMHAGERLDLFDPLGRRARVSMTSHLAINTVGAIAAAVEAGAGLHAGPRWVLDPLIAEGRLVEVLPDWKPAPFDVHGLHTFGQRPPARIARLLDMLGPKLKALPGVD